MDELNEFKSNKVDQGQPPKMATDRERSEQSALRHLLLDPTVIKQLAYLPQLAIAAADPHRGLTRYHPITATMCDGIELRVLGDKRASMNLN